MKLIDVNQNIPNKANHQATTLSSVSILPAGEDCKIITLTIILN
jgi:hypothetical protein